MCSPVAYAYVNVGADVTVDTRVDPTYPRNAIYATAGWEQLRFDGGASVGRLRTEARGYVGLFGQSVLSLRARYHRADAPLPAPGAAWQPVALGALVALQLALVPTASWNVMGGALRTLALDGPAGVVAAFAPERLLARHFRATAAPSDRLLFAHGSLDVQAELPGRAQPVSWHNPRLFALHAGGQPGLPVLEASGASHVVARGLDALGDLLADAVAQGVLFAPGAWYESLSKPTWNPPSWLFGPVWTTLYALLGTGAWLVSREPGPVAAEARPRAWLAFAVHAVLNLAWTPLFFGLRSPGWAFADIVLLWVATLWMTLSFGRVRPLAGTLQVPLVAWVSFALVLNGTIWLMN